MGIILLTELGRTPWQLRFSQSLPLPVVSQLMLDTMDMGLLLPTIPMADLASPTEAPRVFMDTSTRERLRPAMDMDLPLPTIPMVDLATPREAPRVFMDTSTRERPMPATDTTTDLALPASEFLLLPPLMATTLPAILMDLTSTTMERDLLSPLTSVDMDMDPELATSMSPDPTLPTAWKFTTVR